MRRKICTLLLVAFTTALPLLAVGERSIGDRSFVFENGGWNQIDPDGSSYRVDDRVITVKLLEGVASAPANALHAGIGVEVLRRARTGYIDLQLPTGLDVFQAIDHYLASGLVESAEPNTIGRYGVTPDDTSYGNQWWLPQVNAEEAWDQTPGAPGAIIAVLDSGTEFTHEDLGTGPDAYQNVWLNSGEDAWADPDNPATGNGIDDDLNGYVDDWKGYDFSNDDNNSAGSFFHGTAVAGVAAAKTNNALGVAGTAGGWNGPGARIMIAGVGDSGPNGAILDDAILYAADMGAQVVQLSLSVGQTGAIDAALQAAWDAGLIIICSSGNGGGSSVSYPAINPNVMAIGATNESDLRASFSQHGPDLEISAPGTNILTLDLNDGYGSTGGTSFSSPLVSGVVALMLSADPSLTNTQIRQILKDTADKVGGYDYDWNAGMPGHSFELGYGRVNAQAALDALDIFTDGFESGDTSAWSSTTP